MVEAGTTSVTEVSRVQVRAIRTLIGTMKLLLATESTMIGTEPKMNCRIIADTNKRTGTIRILLRRLGDVTFVGMTVNHKLLGRTRTKA